MADEPGQCVATIEVLGALGQDAAHVHLLRSPGAICFSRVAELPVGSGQAFVLHVQEVSIFSSTVTVSERSLGC